jgi:hypothetical protein
MFGYLYIAEEVIRDNSLKRVPTNFCKIGITTQKIPAERLRKLQAGNPRQIRFPHLWIGTTERIATVEQHVKAKYSSERRLEWIYRPSVDVKNYVELLIDDVPDIFSVPNRYLPYTASSYGQCVFGNENKDTTAIYFEAKELADKI